MANNDYDRILRENIQEIFVHYVERTLNIEVLESRTLPTKLTGTFENEVDHLVLAKTGSGEEVLVHFEFQTSNDPRMLERIKRYHGMLFYKYKLPIHHFVVYLGKEKASMRSALKDTEIFMGFHLISIGDQKLESFLASQNPEEILLGILSDFGASGIEESVLKIIGAIEIASPDEVRKKRHLKQLKILARLRKLDTVVHEIISKMPLNLDVRDSIDYKLGMEEGEERGEIRGEENVWKKSSLAILKLVSDGAISIEQAAEAFGITEAEMNQRIEAAKQDSGLK